MSQFITTSGKYIDLEGLKPFKLIPVADAQDYIRNLAQSIRYLDGDELYFVDDGCTGTSEDIFEVAGEMIFEKGNIEGSPLEQLLTKLVDAGHTIRIWWADNNPDSYKIVKDCSTLSELKAELCEQHPIYRVRYSANNMFV